MMDNKPQANTILGVNKKYATDKNWGNSVYKYMKYLYSKI